jgi:hypothetical protein
MQIDIPSISLDVKNFRHGEVTTEREAIQLLLADEKTHKVAELAADIVDMGMMDPSSSLIVMKDPVNVNHYIALEGNRRITALKTLINPELANGCPTLGSFKALSSKFMLLGINTIECFVVNDRKEASPWIKRKHYNAMGGKGVMPWNAIATARSDASEGRAPRWMTALDLIKKYNEQTTTLQDSISSKTTTVERVLASSYMSSILGITFKNGSVISENNNGEAAAKLLESMFIDMGKNNFTEPTVTTAKLQGDFINNFVHLNVKKKDTYQNNNSEKPLSGYSSNSLFGNLAGHTGSVSNSGVNEQKISSIPLTGKQSSTQRSIPVRSRKILAQKGLRITNDALNKLYHELMKLNVTTSPHVGAAMVRIFVEKATMVFLYEMKVNCKNPNGWISYENKLREKIAAVLNVIDEKKSNMKLNYARDAANSVRDKLHTLDYLNRAIHDHTTLPSPTEIIDIWDRYHPYFDELFKVLETKGK